MKRLKIGLNILLWSFILFYAIGPSLLINNKKQINNINIYSDKLIGDEYDSLFNNSIFSDTMIFNDRYHYNIYLTNSYNKFTALTLLSYKSFGITKPFFGQIIIAPSSIKENLVTRNGDINNKRALSSVIKHECTHKYLMQKYGTIKNIYYAKTQKWKIEGYCDYKAQESSFGFARGVGYLLENKTEESNSFSYFKYRLYVQYLIDYENMNFDEILERDFDTKQLQEEIIEKIKNKEYIPPTV